MRRWTALRARSAAEPARRARPPRPTARPELGGEEVDLLARAGGARGVAEGLGLGERVAQIVEPAAVARARLVVEQLAGVAAVDGRVVGGARAPPTGRARESRGPGSATSRARYCRPRLSFRRKARPAGAGDRPVLALEHERRARRGAGRDRRGGRRRRRAVRHPRSRRRVERGGPGRACASASASARASASSAPARRVVVGRRGAAARAAESYCVRASSGRASRRPQAREGVLEVGARPRPSARGARRAAPSTRADRTLPLHLGHARA